MDVTLTASQTLSHAKLPSRSTAVFHPRSSLLAHNSTHFQSPKSTTLFPQLHVFSIKRRKHRNFGAVHASEGESTVNDVEDRWLLEPVGDGDSRHIGYKVKMPDAFELVSSEVTVGRLPEKANMVIPVATVSGIHARIQKKGGSLVVTDLDSTNGTFINQKRLRPGVAAPAPSGSVITFGDIHLAMFRVSKLENVEAASKSEQSEVQQETGTSPTDEGNETN